MMHMIKWERAFNEYRPPFCYGLGYRKVACLMEVYYLIPINYIVRIGKYISYQWDKHRGKPSWVDRKVKEELVRSMFEMNLEFLALLRSASVTLILDEGILRIQARTSCEGQQIFGYEHTVPLDKVLTSRFDYIRYIISKIRREIDRAKREIAENRA